MSSTKDLVMSTFTIELANLDLKKHTQAIINLLDLFSKDKMGQNEPLEEGIKKDVIQELRKHPTTLVLLAFKYEQPIGLVTAFLGFSTFTAKQTLKIHDLLVHPDARGLGLETKLLDLVQEEAERRDCSKITLEVREDNPAKKLYEREGFEFGEPRWWYMTKELPA